MIGSAPRSLLVAAALAGLAAGACGLDAAGLGDDTPDQEGTLDADGTLPPDDAGGGDHGTLRDDAGRETEDGRPPDDADGADDARPDGDADGGCTGPADCDDGIPCTVDSCDLLLVVCRHEPNHAACDDGIACTDDACDAAGGRCNHVPRDARCDDGDACNGPETCDVATGCGAGAPVVCDDGVACTVDVCEPTSGTCSRWADAALCDDGQMCNGPEWCDPTAGCLPGMPPSCDDERTCNVDGCDWMAAGGRGACLFTPLDVDGDTWGDAACDGDDCNDANPAVHPDAADPCNGTDEDCSGYPDDRPGSCAACTFGAYGGHSYQFCSAALLNWSTARTTCAAYGYTLATINDLAENDWLAATAHGVRTSPWWIGANDVAAEGTWTWAGSPSTYFHWHAGEPNNAGGNEDCAAIDVWWPAMDWNDARCSDLNPFVCELP